MEYPTPMVYIAGPMTGIKHFNAEAFFHAADVMEDMGYIVKNPAQHDIDSGFDPFLWEGTESLEETGFDLEAAMTWDLQQVRDADAVIVLPGGKDSKGLGRELNEALTNGTPVYYYGVDFRDEYLDFHTPSELVPCRFCYPDSKNKPFGKQRFRNYTWDTSLVTSDPTTTLLETGEFVFSAEQMAKIGLKFADTIRDGLNKGNASGPAEPTYPFPTPKNTGGNLFAENTWTGDKGEVRTVSSTGGEKGTKLARYDLLPVDALKQIAEHYGRGAEKYDDNQWRKGYEWSKSFAALMRHAQQFWGGEDFDEETGSNHMAAVAWHALALLTFYDEFPEFDDRFKS